MPGFTAVNEEPADTDAHVEASHKPASALNWPFLLMNCLALALLGVLLPLA